MYLNSFVEEGIFNKWYQNVLVLRLKLLNFITKLLSFYLHFCLCSQQYQ